jgi:hypothetical protein
LNPPVSSVSNFSSPTLQKRVKVSQNLLKLDEDRLLRVELAIRELEATGQSVTLRSVGELSGIHPSNLRLYPQVRELLDQHIRTNHIPYSVQVAENENALIVQVETAIKQLESLKQPVTRVAVSQIIGVPQYRFNMYPHVKALFEQRASQYRHQKTKEHEDELLLKVVEAVKQLEMLELPISHKSICEIVGKSPDTLYRLPRVKDLLQQYNRLNQGRKKFQAKLNGDELYTRIVLTMKQLEDFGQSVTLAAVCKSIGIQKSELIHYPQVETLIKQIREKDRQHRVELSQQREKQLLEEVEAALGKLEEAQQPISIREVSRIVGMSPAGLSRYSKIHARIKKAIAALSKARGRTSSMG